VPIVRFSLAEGRGQAQNLVMKASDEYHQYHAGMFNSLFKSDRQNKLQGNGVTAPSGPASLK
jgi:hypothetical protein